MLHVPARQNRATLQYLRLSFFICKMGMVTLVPLSRAKWYWVCLMDVRVLEIGKYHVELESGS